MIVIPLFTAEDICLQIVTVEPFDNIPEPEKTYHVWWEEIKEQEVPEFNQ